MTKNETAASMGVEGVTVGRDLFSLRVRKGIWQLPEGGIFKVVLRPLEQRLDLLHPSRKLLTK